MKNIILLIALLLSLSAVGMAQKSVTHSVARQTIQTDPTVTNCCCNPEDGVATIQGQLITGGLWNPRMTRLVVAQFDTSQNLVSQIELPVNLFGYYSAMIKPCYDTFLIPKAIKVPTNTQVSWSPGSAYIWLPAANVTYFNNFVLTDVVTY